MYLFIYLFSAGVYRHEAAYVLGQLKSVAAVSFLEKTLRDKTEDEMVRHEVS